MPTLFDPLKVGNMELDNRIIMGPMTRSRADDEGIQPDYTATYYGQRASAGLIITEATNVSPMAKGYVRTPGIYTDAQVESWRPVTKSVHVVAEKFSCRSSTPDASHCPIFCQATPSLSHRARFELTARTTQTRE